MLIRKLFSQSSINKTRLVCLPISIHNCKQLQMKALHKKISKNLGEKNGESTIFSNEAAIIPLSKIFHRLSTSYIKY